MAVHMNTIQQEAVYIMMIWKWDDRKNNLWSYMHDSIL